MRSPENKRSTGKEIGKFTFRSIVAAAILASGSSSGMRPESSADSAEVVGNRMYLMDRGAYVTPMPHEREYGIVDVDGGSDPDKTLPKAKELLADMGCRFESGDPLESPVDGQGAGIQKMEKVGEVLLFENPDCLPELR